MEWGRTSMRTVGKIFEGKYEGDKKHGPGVFYWPDGSRVIGIWQNGRQHGVGTHFNEDGVARKGKWKSGNLEQWLGKADPEENERSDGKENEVVFVNKTHLLAQGGGY